MIVFLGRSLPKTTTKVRWARWLSLEWLRDRNTLYICECVCVCGAVAWHLLRISSKHAEMCEALGKSEMMQFHEQFIRICLYLLVAGVGVGNGGGGCGLAIRSAGVVDFDVLWRPVLVVLFFLLCCAVRVDRQPYAYICIRRCWGKLYTQWYLPSGAIHAANKQSQFS